VKHPDHCYCIVCRKSGAGGTDDITKPRKQSYLFHES